MNIISVNKAIEGLFEKLILFLAIADKKVVNIEAYTELHAFLLQWIKKYF